MEFEPDKPESVLNILLNLSPDSSKATLRGWIKQGRVVVDGVTVSRASDEVQPGQILRVLGRRHLSAAELPILYRDRDVIVIDKPAGLLTVATDSGAGDTAHGRLKTMLKGQRVYPVHRLDRETSGVLVFALSEQARDGLKEQFAAHTVLRHYVAVVGSGQLPGKGTWTSWLYEDANLNVLSSPEAGRGKRAVTHYKVLKQGRRSSLLELSLETGRRHQIRVHCADAGHPILGDQRYHGPRAQRLCLHARTLGFVHPVTGKQVRCDSGIPPFFTQLVGGRRA